MVTTTPEVEHICIEWNPDGFCVECALLPYDGNPASEPRHEHVPSRFPDPEGYCYACGEKLEVAAQPDPPAQGPERIWIEQPEDGYCRELWHPEKPRQLEPPKYKNIGYHRDDLCVRAPASLKIENASLNREMNAMLEDVNQTKRRVIEAAQTIEAKWRSSKEECQGRDLDAAYYEGGEAAAIEIQAAIDTNSVVASSLTEAQAAGLAERIIRAWHHYEKWRDPSMMPIPPFSGAQEEELRRLIAIELLRVAAPAVEWQPLNTIPPPKNESVLVWIDDIENSTHGVVVTRFCPDDPQKQSAEDMVLKATHWMPLPNPPSQRKG